MKCENMQSESVSQNLVYRLPNWVIQEKFEARNLKIVLNGHDVGDTNHSFRTLFKVHTIPFSASY